MQVKMVEDNEETVFMDIKIVKDGKRTETTMSVPESLGIGMNASLKLVTSEDNTYEEVEIKAEGSRIIYDAGNTKLKRI
jgi:hypothetical protein